MLARTKGAISKIRAASSVAVYGSLVLLLWDLQNSGLYLNKKEDGNLTKVISSKINPIKIDTMENRKKKPSVKSEKIIEADEGNINVQDEVIIEIEYEDKDDEVHLVKSVAYEVKHKDKD